MRNAPREFVAHPDGRRRQRLPVGAWLEGQLDGQRAHRAE